MEPIKRYIYDYRCKHPSGNKPMSAEKFASECGIHRNTYIKIMQGNTPTLGTLLKIANLLGVSIDDLIGREV